MSETIRIYADMIADLFHRGHVEFIKKAKHLTVNSHLIIGIHSDQDCISYKRKPIFSMEDRVEIIKSCKYVDEIITNAPLKITKNFIKIHKINIVTHGDDLTNFLININYKYPIEVGIMKTVPYYKGISSTDIIKRIKDIKWEI
jgi:cytidyltransferase-like protein